MDVWLRELIGQLGGELPHGAQLLRIVCRLATAALLGAVLGYQRERAGKPAGLRTHMLVALGAALFVLAAQEAGMSVEDLSRIIQGLIAGIGFLGAGAILKSAPEADIKGLTSAAGIWLTAAVGVAAGLGQWVVAAVGVAMGWAILAWLGSGNADDDRGHGEHPGG
jgi:putative Mg2+ transporter-C (MgtC) family protein